MARHPRGFDMSNPYPVVVLLFVCLSLIITPAYAQSGTLDVEIGSATGTTIFARALAASGLDATVGDAGTEYTVFVPTDGAFAAFQEELGIDESTLLGDTASLTRVLNFHIVEGRYTFSDIVALTQQNTDAPDTTRIPTLSGASIDFAYNPTTGQLTLEDARATLTATNNDASNGVFHIMDAVLLPLSVTGSDTTDTASTTDNTASTDTTTEATATPEGPTATPSPPQSATGYNAGSVTDVISRNPQLSFLLEAGEKVGMAAALNDLEKEYTLFAPTDTAFDNLRFQLGFSRGEMLNNSLLERILGYHVVEGTLMKADLLALDRESVETLYPDNFIVPRATPNGGIVVNRIVAVIATDIPATNGTVHVVNNVMLPYDALERFGIAVP
ncbi:MAG: fasciclin domain-containing protein [Chloroflexota bacterium]